MRKSKTSATMEMLENRMLFSTSAEAAVQADETKLAADKAQLASDRKAASTLVSADRTQLNADRKSLIASAVTQLNTDQTNATQTIVADKTAGANLINSDRATIVTDHNKVVADRKNPTAETAELAQLATDKSTLTTDSTNLKNTLATDRAHRSAVVNTDRAALNTFRTQGDATVISDQQRVTADGKSTGTILFNDGKAIAADEVQLYKDRLAEITSIFGDL